MAFCISQVVACWRWPSEAESGATPYLSTKLVTGRFFMERMLPETAANLARIQSGCATIMELPAEAF